MKTTVIGLDFGTLSARAAAFDIRTGEEKSELIPPEQCETLMRDWKFDADEIFHD